MHTCHDVKSDVTLLPAGYHITTVKKNTPRRLQKKMAKRINLNRISKRTFMLKQNRRIITLLCCLALASQTFPELTDARYLSMDMYHFSKSLKINVDHRRNLELREMPACLALSES
jgi:hypothetical protein